MKQKTFDTDEVRFFYLWLSGQTKQGGEDKRLIFLCCPAERENILKEFLVEFHAEHRYSLLRRAILSK